MLTREVIQTTIKQYAQKRHPRGYKFEAYTRPLELRVDVYWIEPDGAQHCETVDYTTNPCLHETGVKEVF